jgi:hypothetical protein
VARVAQALGACGAQVLPVSVATASSVQQNHFLASWAVDGDLSTRWSSNQGMPQWLQLDMGQSVYISGLNIDWQTAFSTAYVVEASDNASSWATVATSAATQAGWQDLTEINVTARYLRIYSTGATSYGNISIIEAQVIGDTNTACGTVETTCGESIKLLPAAAQASSQQSSNYPASAAIDGVWSTRWSSNFTDNEWLAIDLGGKARVDSMRINWEHAFAETFSVQSGTSMSGPWTTLTTLSGQFGPQTVPNLNTTTQFLRILGVTRETSYGYSIWEAEVYGSRDVSCVNLLKGPWKFSTADFAPSNVYAISGDTVAFTYNGGNFTWGPNGYNGIDFVQPVSVVKGGTYNLTLTLASFSGGPPALFGATISGAGGPTNPPGSTGLWEIDTAGGSTTLSFSVTSAPGTSPTIDLLNRPIFSVPAPGLSEGVGLSDFTVTATLTKTN